MMTRFRESYARLTQLYADPLNAQRARSLTLMSLGIFLLGIVWLVVAAALAVTQSFEIAQQISITPVVVLLVSVASIWLIQIRRLQIAIGLFIGVLLAAVLVTLLSGSHGASGISGAHSLVVVLPMIAASALLGRRGITLVLLLVLGILAGAIFDQLANTVSISFVPSNTVALDAVIIISITVITFIFAQVFSGRLERIAYTALDEVQQRDWIMRLSSDLYDRNDEADVIARTLTVARQNLPGLSLEFYLKDTDGGLKRILTTAPDRLDRMLRRSLPVNDQSILAEAGRLGKIVLASDTDPIERRSHLAETSRYGAAVPVGHRGDVIGVLDVQGRKSFTPVERLVFDLLADTLALALIRVRRMAELERIAQDQQELVRVLQGQLEQHVRREQQTLHQVWGNYVAGRGQNAVGYDIEAGGVKPIPASDLPQSMMTVLRTGTLQVEMQGDTQLIHVPIRVRDQNLGAMSFTIPPGQTLNDRQIDVARVVAERLALALENTRLFEQSQALAERERTASRLGGTLIGTSDVLSVLDLAAERFNEALGAVRTQIYLQPQTLAEPAAETIQEATQA
ncbi:MAG: GAF domain-containing protein [Anaerolineae bacterium]|nr:GAF domain-containing protein [Anaerolineae bacterium]